MGKNSFQTLCVYLVVYAIAQGIMDAYEEAIETPYLHTEHGINFDLVGTIQTVDFLPWCVKFVWAIPSDSYDFYGYGHRRPYVVMGIMLAAAAFASVSTFNPADYVWAYMICMSVRNIGIAVADCAVNGLSVDCQMDTESGAISGWMSLGRTIGTILASIAGTAIAAKFGYEEGILASACLMVISIPVNWFIQEEWVDEKAYEDKVDEAASAAASKSMTDEENYKGFLQSKNKSNNLGEVGGWRYVCYRCCIRHHDRPIDWIQYDS